MYAQASSRLTSRASLALDREFNEGLMKEIDVAYLLPCPSKRTFAKRRLTIFGSSDSPPGPLS
jgi:hypothetical protein